MVEILHTDFQYGRLLRDCTWHTVVIITKGKEYFRGFGLVEVLWKVLSGFINWHIGAAVRFHDVMHSFQEVLGKGTVSLEAKFSSS